MGGKGRGFRLPFFPFFKLGHDGSLAPSQSAPLLPAVEDGDASGGEFAPDESMLLLN